MVDNRPLTDQEWYEMIQDTLRKAAPVLKIWHERQNRPRVACPTCQFEHLVNGECDYCVE